MSRQNRFLLTSPLSVPGEYVLDPLDSHHAVNVLRLRAGNVVVVFDGIGNYADAAIVLADKKGVRVSVGEILTEPRLPLELTIATAVPKGKRWQVLVEKCTELGVDRLVPLLTDRSVVRAEGDPEKWRRWVIEAAKQCRRAFLPEVTHPLRLDEVLAQIRTGGGCLLHCDPLGDGPAVIREWLVGAKKALVLIGPEGGFSEAELAACQAAGSRAIKLSNFILRVETAAPAACLLIREAL